MFPFIVVNQVGVRFGEVSRKERVRLISRSLSDTVFSKDFLVTVYRTTVSVLNAVILGTPIFIFWAVMLSWAGFLGAPMPEDIQVGATVGEILGPLWDLTRIMATLTFLVALVTYGWRAEKHLSRSYALHWARHLAKLKPEFAGVAPGTFRLYDSLNDQAGKKRHTVLASLRDKLTGYVLGAGWLYLLLLSLGLGLLGTVAATAGLVAVGFAMMPTIRRYQRAVRYHKPTSTPAL